MVEVLDVFSVFHAERWRFNGFGLQKFSDESWEKKKKTLKNGKQIVGLKGWPWVVDTVDTPANLGIPSMPCLSHWTFQRNLCVLSAGEADGQAEEAFTTKKCTKN